MSVTIAMMSVRVCFVCLAILAHSGVSAKETLGTDNVLNTISIQYEDIADGRFALGEELLLQVALKSHNLGDIFAVIDEVGLFLELKPYLEFAEFPIEANPDQTVFSGWFIKEEYTFQLDLRESEQLKVNIAGEWYFFSSELVKNIDGRVYVHEALFDKWFGIDHEYKFSALRLNFLPSEPLPLQQRLAREGRTVRIGGAAEASYPQLTRSYGILSPQTFDFQIGANFQESTNTLFGQYSILGARDIALVHSNFFIAGNDDDPFTDSRLIFSRESIDKDLLGIGAARVEFGDIQPVRQGLTRNRSRGLLISNTVIGNTFDKEQVNLVGPLQQGWDVELYRDGVLLDRELNVQTGEYSFLDIELNFGPNNFEIIKYGPQGQIEKEQRQQLLDQSTFSKRGVNYAFSLSENDKSLLGTQNFVSSTDNGYNFASDISFNTLGSNWGLGLQTDFGGDNKQTELSVNTSRVIGNAFVTRAFLNARTDESVNYGVGVAGRYGSQTINAGLNQNSSVIENELRERVVSTNANLNITGSLFETTLGKLNQNTLINFSDGIDQTRLSIQNRLGLNTDIGNFFNNIEYTKLETPSDIQDSLRGSFIYNELFGRLHTQVNLGYKIEDDFELTSVSGFLNYSFNNSLRARLSASYRLDTDNTTNNLNLNYRTGKFNISGNIGHSSVSGWLAGLTTTFSLSAQPLVYGTTFHTSRSVVNTGSLSVRVFVDENGNHSYDEGEILVPGVTVISQQSRARATTDSMGIASLVGLSHNIQSDIEVDPNSFPDPFLAPVIEGVSIRFRRGIADSLDFPLELTTEIEGTAFVHNQEGVPIPATKVPIILQDKYGKVVARQVTEFDGYYVLGKIPAGEYRMSVEDKFLLQNNLQKIAPINVSVDPYSGEFELQDILLERKNAVVGFFAQIGEFSSHAQLNLFYRVYKSKLLPVKHLLAIKETGTALQLTSKFFFEEQDAVSLCTQLKSKNIECKILQHTHFY